MCGIVGYIGERKAYPILIKGLQRLEYRGYDSSGVAIHNNEDINLFKCKGKVVDLENYVGNSDTNGCAGIGHTRWATHGEPNDVNAHPHFSQSKNLVMIHNGIIENYDVIKKQLKSRGYTFKSDTDTEIFINLIEDIQKSAKVKLGEAVRIALKKVVGAYAIAILDKNNPNVLIAAKKSSPLVVGVGDGEFFLASDATPIVEYTKNVVYLEDGQIVILKKGSELKVVNIDDEVQAPYIQELDLQLEELEKGGYDHFMLKEIYEQPRSINDSLRGRLDVKKRHRNPRGNKRLRTKIYQCPTTNYSCLRNILACWLGGRIPFRRAC